MTSKYDERIITNNVTISVLDDTIHVSPRETYIVTEIKNKKHIYCFILTTLVIIGIIVYVIFSILL